MAAKDREIPTQEEFQKTVKRTVNKKLDRLRDKKLKEAQESLEKEK